VGKARVSASNFCRVAKRVNIILGISLISWNCLWRKSEMENKTSSEMKGKEHRT